jgi:hypothetical protein
MYYWQGWYAHHVFIAKLNNQMERSFKPQGTAMDNIREGASRSPESLSLDKMEKDASPSFTQGHTCSPSNWPNWLKRLVLFQVVAQVFLASGCAPAFVRGRLEAAYP